MACSALVRQDVEKAQKAISGETAKNTPIPFDRYCRNMRRISGNESAVPCRKSSVKQVMVKSRSESTRANRNVSSSFTVVNLAGCMGISRSDFNVSSSVSRQIR